MNKKVFVTAIFVVVIAVVLSLSQAQAASGYRLRTSEGWTVGHAFVTNDADNLMVTFEMRYDLGFCLYETQLHVADTWQQIPQDSGSPAPDLFDYVDAHDCADMVEYVVPLGGWEPGDTITIAAHAVIGNWMDKPYPGWEETGWAAGCESVKYNPEPGLDCEIYAPYPVKESGELPEDSVNLALVAIYNSTDGDNWLENTNWLDETIHYCDWGRIVCDGDNLRNLELGFNNLSGTLPPEIGDLGNIMYLYFASNQLTGEIPPEVGNLTNLRRLELSMNQFTGLIPPELGNLVNLEYLQVWGNQLGGCIPAELSNMSSLTNLYLHDNTFSGWETQEALDWALSLPAYSGPENVDCDCGSCSIEDLEREALVALYNSTNGDNWATNTNWLNETIHHCEWYGITCDEENNVTGIGMSFNELTGSLPPELGNLSTLEALNLTGNFYLTGPIPPELGNLANLKSLVLWMSQLTGSIPPELGNLSNLESLILASNQLTGSIPPELGNLSNLWNLKLENNQLTGSIPKEIGNLTNLTHLILDNNQLNSCIPSELSNLSSLYHLTMEENTFSGWETQAALDWALSLVYFRGPENVAASCP